MKRVILHDFLDYMGVSMRSLCRDEFTRCFEPIKPNNPLDSGFFYLFSLLVRYLIFLPLRITVLSISSIVFILMIFKGSMNEDEQLISLAFLFYMKALNLCFFVKTKHVGIKRRLKMPHIFVANHTSFLDFILLSSEKFCHACVAENHSGLFGWIYNGILKINGSLSFKRNEKSDKELVREKIKKHVLKQSVPILIFPEGTCVNNKYSVLYQKGAFDLDVTVCPVAIRYSRQLLDPYWNRRRYNFIMMFFYYLTRWFIEVEITWLDPTKRQKGEEPEEFARRVKSSISKIAKLHNTNWNGYLKSNIMVKDRYMLRDAYRKAYDVILKEREEFLNKSTEYKLKHRVPNYPFVSEYDKIKYFDVIGYQTFINIVLKQYFDLKKYHFRDYEEYEDVLDLWIQEEDDTAPKCQCH